MFVLHPKLKADTIFIKDLEICRLLLMNNANFPWLILVPMRDNLQEIYDLPATDYAKTMEEIHTVTEKFAKHTKADKMNVAMLGNIVSQLHIHVIARFKDDVAWPNPVWGKLLEKPYQNVNIEQLSYIF